MITDLRASKMFLLLHDGESVAGYNHERLHSALGYVTPADKLNGLAEVIFAERDRKLEEARARRQAARQTLREVA